PRLAGIAQHGLGARLTGPRRDPLRVERGRLLETLERLLRMIVGQQDPAFREPRIREIPLEGDRAVVVLDRRAPSTLLVQQRSFPMEDRSVLGVVVVGAGDADLRGRAVGWM